MKHRHNCLLVGSDLTRVLFQAGIRSSSQWSPSARIAKAWPFPLLADATVCMHFWCVPLCTPLLNTPKKFRPDGKSMQPTESEEIDFIACFPCYGKSPRKKLFCRRFTLQKILIDVNLPKLEGLSTPKMLPCKGWTEELFPSGIGFLFGMKRRQKESRSLHSSEIGGGREPTLGSKMPGQTTRGWSLHVLCRNYSGISNRESSSSACLWGSFSELWNFWVCTLTHTLLNSIYYGTFEHVHTLLVSYTLEHISEDTHTSECVLEHTFLSPYRHIDPIWNTHFWGHTHLWVPHTFSPKIAA